MKDEMYSLRDRRLDERQALWDDDLSLKHRGWGNPLTGVDLDCVVTTKGNKASGGLTLAEYYRGKVCAIIEYKHFNAWGKVDLNHYSFAALNDLASNRFEPIPFLIAYYFPQNWSFVVSPLNSPGEKYFTSKRPTSERYFVRKLYEMRGLTISETTRKKLNNGLPPIKLDDLS